MKKLLSLVLAAVLLAGLLPAPALAQGNGGAREYGNYAFTKVSNPTAGPGEPDGINTNDETGYPANRHNSYAWSAASRGDYLYIGTNRNLFGSALNALGEIIRQRNPNLDLSQEGLNALASVLSGGDMPLICGEEDYLPQIIRFDTANGTTKVIYRPATVRGADGVLYYADKDGKIVEGADVVSETASFRSVVEFRGNLYFGSLGTNMLQLVRVDEEDNAEVVFQTLGLISSLRAGCVYNDGVTGETVYFGGQDTTYEPWRAYRQDNPDSGVLPIVIRYLDPETAGTDREDWSGLVADYRDFGKYAEATVYKSGGGTVWDLCSYNGRLYVILAYDGGWAMFRGERGGDSPNTFGWTWTEIVGDDGKYPLAMDETVAELNEQFREDYGCTKYCEAYQMDLSIPGLLESTATPYVYNGKMYIGTFDNSTAIQTQTMIKLIVKLLCLFNSKDDGDTGPTLTEIYAPIYEMLDHPQRVWVMDAEENITAVESANALLKGTTNDYVWRFAELDGKLYAGTFDGATSYSPYLNLFSEKQRELLKKVGLLPDDLLAAMDGSNIDRLEEWIDSLLEGDTELSDDTRSMLTMAKAACALFRTVLEDGTSVEELTGVMVTLKSMYSLVIMFNPDAIPEEAKALIDWLLETVDVEGLDYWARARALVNNAEGGFDLLVSEDGENWDSIVEDGIGDYYNYGARTLTAHQGDLYIGTANPYYGAQLWKMTDATPIKLPETAELTAGDVMPGFITRGEASSDDPSVAWVDSDGNLRALKEGTTVIRAGDETCKVKVNRFEDGSEVVGQLKLLARYDDSMKFYDGHTYLLFTSYKDGVTIEVPDLYAGYEISDLYYEDIGKDISCGSNHNKDTTADNYFTLRDGMNSVTLDRGEIVTIGMYRGFDLSVAQAALAVVRNSTLWTDLRLAEKTAVAEAILRFLESGAVGSDASLIDAIKEAAGEDADYTKLLDGVAEGGVCFNRELYNQKLEWDQYENVTYELDITQNQLDAMIGALGGNLNRFSILNNSCTTVALRAWNAAVGTRDGEDTAYKLEASGKRIYAIIDAPKTVRDEIMNKLPGYYLNNAQGVAEPNAGFRDETGWVYVSAPEALPGGSLSAKVIDGGLSVRVAPQTEATFTGGFCAAYDSDGRMLGTVPFAPVGKKQTLTLPCDGSKAVTVKAFFLDGGMCPAAEPLTCPVVQSAK